MPAHVDEEASDLVSPLNASGVTAADDVLLLMRCISECVAELMRRVTAGKTHDLDIRRMKNTIASRIGCNRAPKLVDIIAAVPEEWKKRLLPLLTAKPIRSASGISVVAVMCKPHRCPHIAMTGAICMYCAGGPDSDFEYSTQAYTGYEPTSMRAIRARYDPYKQTRNRVEQLERLGHVS